MTHACFAELSMLLNMTTFEQYSISDAIVKNIAHSACYWFVTSAETKGGKDACLAGANHPA